jgi:hypothetical protein
MVLSLEEYYSLLYWAAEYPAVIAVHYIWQTAPVINAWPAVALVDNGLCFPKTPEHRKNLEAITTLSAMIVTR